MTETIIASADETVMAGRGFSALHYIQWAAANAGAIAAAALGLVLHGFATAIGLSLSSTSPSWRDSSFALTLLAGLYLLFAAVIAYGLGGYVTGRSSFVLPALTAEDRAETEFRDGTNGLVAWALATLLMGLIALGAAQGAARAGAAGAQPSSAAESLIAFDLDRLFRGDRPVVGDIAYARAEAGRILLTANSHQGMQADDRDYLVHLVERTITLLAYTALLAAIITWLADGAMHALAGEPGQVFLVLWAYALAIGGAVTGVAAAFGPAAGVVLTIFLVIIGNPSSGGPVSTALLPAFFRTLNPYLPQGGGLWLLRDVVYFGSHELTRGAVCLLAWGGSGLLLASIAVLGREIANRRTTRTSTRTA